MKKEAATRWKRSLLRWYHAHAVWAKIGGVLVFLVVVASLYFAVLSSPRSVGVALGVTPTVPVTTQASGTPTSAPSPTSSSAPASTSTSAFPPGLYQANVQKDVSYGPLGGAEQLDLCTPVGARGLRPGVVLIHGGGFEQGNKSSYDQFCSYLASQGFVAATLNYRLAPLNVWPAQLVDVQLAVRWLRAHASEYALDTRRLCSFGDSAGGHLAVFLGVLSTIHPGDEAGLLSNQSPKVSCVVDEFGPVDMTALTRNAFWQGVFPSLFRVGGQSNQATLRDASPLFLVSARSAPTLIIQGTKDTIVPPSQSQALQTALQQAGVSVGYISYAGEHAFGSLSNEQITALQSQAFAYLVKQEQP
jgi:acetyl esterase/lipase